jgi:hypothetical protein
VKDDAGVESVVKRLRGSRCGIILDIDETLLNPLPLYHRGVNAEMNLTLTVQEIEEAGGLDGVFKNHPRYQEFKLFADRCRGDDIFNSDVPLIEGAIAGINKLQEIPGLVIGAYLTTRPTCVTQVTVSDLMVKGFPVAPVLARPEGIIRESTIEWKLSVLGGLNNSYSGNIVMIDDSLALAKAIREANQGSQKSIVTILFNGPLTYTAVKREQVVSFPAEHFFVAEWKDIPEICKAYSF